MEKTKNEIDYNISKKLKEAKNKIDEFTLVQKPVLEYCFAPPDGRAKRRERRKKERLAKK